MISNSIYQALEIRSKLKVARQNNNFNRFLLAEIKKKRRLTAITGIRGTGKTTLLLQLARNASADLQPWRYSKDKPT
jgi:predicted AAA+ superfamily ATPase